MDDESSPCFQLNLKIVLAHAIDYHTMAPKHPYYPTKLKLDGFHPLVLEMGYIMAVFGGSMALIAAVTWFVSGKQLKNASWTVLSSPFVHLTSTVSPSISQNASAGKYNKLTTLERIISCWFMMTGAIHFVIEGMMCLFSLDKRKKKN